jgi:hypothetical protein
MVNIAASPRGISAGRFANWTRIALYALVIVALLALSFLLGRATMGHAGTTTTVIRPATVQSVVPPVSAGQPPCHLRGPC